MNRSRVQSTDAPSRRIWLAILPPDSSFHLPYPLDELVTTEIVFALALLVEQPFDHHLRRDACVIHAWLPQRTMPEHAVVSRQHILDRVVEAVPHVQ